MYKYIIQQLFLYINIILPKCIIFSSPSPLTSYALNLE